MQIVSTCKRTSQINKAHNRFNHRRKQYPPYTYSKDSWSQASELDVGSSGGILTQFTSLLGPDRGFWLKMKLSARETGKDYVLLTKPYRASSRLVITSPRSPRIPSCCFANASLALTIAGSLATVSLRNREVYWFTHWEKVGLELENSS